MLTGQIQSPDDIPEGDFRRTTPRFQPDVFEGNLRLVREVEKLAARKGCTPGQVAIGWYVRFVLSLLPFSACLGSRICSRDRTLTSDTPIRE
jgi:aryl-alcohol dehydrogenase-like predicted oxidoreductase